MNCDADVIVVASKLPVRCDVFAGPAIHLPPHSHADVRTPEVKTRKDVVRKRVARIKRVALEARGSASSQRGHPRSLHGHPDRVSRDACETGTGHHDHEAVHIHEPKRLRLGPSRTEGRWRRLSVVGCAQGVTIG